MVAEQPLAADRLHKAVRARALTDPLGAKGLRRTRQRVERETRARRAVFTVVIAAFVACFGFIATSRGGARNAAADSSSQTQPPTSFVAQDGQFTYGRHHRYFSGDNGNATFSFFGQGSGDQSSGSSPTSHVRTKTS